MLNMSAAKISLKEGHNRGFMFSIGVCLVVCVQTLVATIFAKYLSEHPDVTHILRRVALVIFMLISIYFFIKARKNTTTPEIDDTVQSKQIRFFQGIFLSALNIFPIPFQAYMVTTLVSFNWLTLDHTSIGAYIAGAAMGTSIALYIYILFFDNLKNTKLVTTKNMNYAIGTITLVVAMVTLINVIRS
jgi:threonine/homoserine/homoserine lactone efflux protein